MRSLKPLLRTVCFVTTLIALFPVVVEAQTLYKKNFTAAAESEVLLELVATSPGASWRDQGREAATVTIFVDDHYHQDIILFAGSKSFPYRVMLGPLGAGEHRLRIEFNGKQSAKNLTAKIEDAKISLIDRADPRFLAIAHAPILYARANTIGRFSDVPLLMYYETVRDGERTTLRYTVIFSNEDGGTQTSALMARWGRTTDIEWVIETLIDSQGKIIKSAYQGINHETTTFRGTREADHPLLVVASDNNNFADNGKSEMRYALCPIAVDLSKSSREEIMDRHPWIYPVMADEMIREGKITKERTLGERIGDLRSYLYLDANSLQRNGAALSFAVKLKGDPRWYASDLGITSYKIDRSGYFRTTIRLPFGTTLDKLERVAARCDLTSNPKSTEEISKATGAQCELQSVNKIFLLNEEYQPDKSLTIKTTAHTLPFGEMIVLYGDCTPQN